MQTRPTAPDTHIFIHREFEIELVRKMKLKCEEFVFVLCKNLIAIHSSILQVAAATKAIEGSEREQLMECK